MIAKRNDLFRRVMGVLPTARSDTIERSYKMSRKGLLAALLALPLAVAGFVYGQTQRQREKPQPVKADGYTCPLTGEELPCPKCCPLNAEK